MSIHQDKLPSSSWNCALWRVEENRACYTHLLHLSELLYAPTIIIYLPLQKTCSIWLHYISEKPNVTLSCSSSTTLNEGDNFTCACRGKGGNPPANVTWYKDGVQIGGTGNEEQTLTLRNVDGTDSGTYKCVAQSHTLAEEKLVEVKVRLNCKYCCILYM